MKQPKPTLGIVSGQPAPNYGKILGLKADRKANRDAARIWMEGIHAYLQSIGRKGGLVGGKSTTPAKQRASRQNGKLGGRPRKDAGKK